MRSAKYFRILVLALFLAASASFAAAQDETIEPKRPGPGMGRQSQPPQDPRARMLLQLGLTPEQMQRLRRVNAERRPLMDAAQKRVHETTRLLDTAIYADEVSDTEIQTRLKDMQLAHAEVLKVRFMNELAVRRILTAEQLARFREMRKRFQQNERGFPERRVSQIRRNHEHDILFF